jgi:hypothetical protein
LTILAGRAFNTVTQRVSSALGLAVLTALATAQQAQFMADRSALLQSSGADANPRILAMEKSGPAGLIPLWQQLRVEVQAEAYSNVFLVAGVSTLAGVALALFLRSGKVPRGDTEPAESSADPTNRTEADAPGKTQTPHPAADPSPTPARPKGVTAMGRSSAAPSRQHQFLGDRRGGSGSPAPPGSA